MIDTDKYEGHTEGPWWFVEDYAEHDDPTFLIRANDNEQLVYHQTGEWLPDKRVDWRLMADAPDLLAEVKQAREIVPKLSRLIGVEIPWIEHDHPITNGIFIGEAVEWNYDRSGEWVLVNYNETRWVTMSYIEAHNVSKYREQVGLKEMIE